MAAECGDTDAYETQQMGSLLEIIDNSPNAKLCTYDINKKPHPVSSALDLETGQLIRLANDIELKNYPLTHNLKTFRNDSYDWREPPSKAVVFDGRLSQHQKFDASGNELDLSP